LHQLQQETDLRKAVQKNQFHNHYQPIVRLDAASLVGFEALIRWPHPHMGMFISRGSSSPPPRRWVSLFPITRHIVEQACRDLQSWQGILGNRIELTMNVNISSRHFLHPSLLDDLREILHSSALPPHQLKLEITETVLMEDSQETVRLAQRLKDFGIRLVMDDFAPATPR